MMEQQFLSKLERALAKLNDGERQDILRDFKEYFASGQAEGKSVEEIITSLGDVDELAAELLKAYSEQEFVQTSKTVKEEEFDHIKIDSELAAIELLPSPTGKFYTELKSKGEQFIMDVEIANNTLTIDIQREESTFKLFGLKININFNIDHGATAFVYVPEKLYQSIVIKNEIGGSVIEKLQAKEIKCHTSVGKTKLKNVLASELNVKSSVGKAELQSVHATTATVKSEAGKVIIEDSIAEIWHVKSEAGRVDLINIQGEIDARTEAGKMTMDVESITKPLKLKTSVGKIEVLTAKAIDNATIEAKSELGKISIYGERGKRLVYGTGENLIKLKTELGSIVIDKKL
ncbi:DUF4097 family beta strand repeat-containing protein [Metasolibacillus meyeri]|uniref:DUF4097 family beta strand repeat-containing protein n=1 Tax=Metasolibacillus meyeri TaxID=1071052 RepID=A0AAW9NSU9_9BACL|nr:DUF4097 family beta strand repeat-containing protein [Metasolibacillus meyeri]MEC1177946.1 DUF4097 family beta strand repeat-containing protein [Metasolibacillus meyeri]